MIGVAIGPPVIQDVNPDGPDGINLIPLGIAPDLSTETTEREYRSEPGFISTYGLEDKRLNISRMVLGNPRKFERLDLLNRAPFGLFVQVRDDVRPAQWYLSRCSCLRMDSYWPPNGTCEASGMVFRYDKMDEVDERRLRLPWSAFEPDPMGIRGLDRASGPSRTVVDMGRPLAGKKERIVYFDEVGIDWRALREGGRAKTAKEQRFIGLDKAAARQDKPATWMTQEEMQRRLVDGELGVDREAADKMAKQIASELTPEQLENPDVKQRVKEAASRAAAHIIKVGDQVYVATGQGSTTTTLKMYGDKVPTPDPQPAPQRPAPQPLVDDDRPRLVRQGASLDELEQGDEALVARQVRLVPQIEETEEPAAVRAVRSAT